jgi:glucosylceramidase
MKYYLSIFFLFFILLGCSRSSMKYSNVRVIQTSASGDLYTQKGIIELSEAQKAESNIITLKPEELFQEIVGIGGAFTEASAYNLDQLGKDNRDEILNAYFGPEGAAYSLTRTHINSCDFSLSSYSYDDVPGDTSLKNFSIQPDMDDLIPFIKDAMQVKGASFKIIASPWTAPPWMKDNNAWFGGSLKKEYYQVWADFFVKYIDAYAEVGIPIWGITVENEPLGNGNSWESMHYTPEEMAQFVGQYLGPTFIQSGVDVKIMIYDQNRDHLKEWADVILSDSVVAPYVWGTAVHWYSSTYDWYPETLNAVHEKFPDKHLIHTESCIDSDVPVWKDDSWYWKKEATDWGIQWAPEEDKYLHPKYVPVYRYARDIIGGLNSWLTGWVDWNLVLDTQGGPNHVENWCIAPIIVKPASNEVYYTPLYYVMKQFSRHIRPGAHRIGIDNPVKDLMVTACLNLDGTISVNLLNQSDKQINYQLSLAGTVANLAIDAQAVQTLVLN